MWIRVTFLAIILLIIGCTSTIDKANEAYRAGNYYSSVKIVTDYLDKAGKFPAEAKTQQLMGVLFSVVEHYRALAEDLNGSYQTRVEGYAGLLHIRNKISYKYYEPYLFNLTQRYNPATLNQVIGELYYRWGNSIVGKQKENYHQRAELFKKGMDYTEYKNIRELYASNQRQYITMQAEEYYQAGRLAIKNSNYQQAAKQFNNAAEVYRPYGTYKDSEQQGVRYDQLYRKNESNRLYKQAQELTRTASKRAEFRKIADLYKESYEIYSQYGQVNNAREQYQIYQEKGIIKLYVAAEGGLSDSVKSTLKQAETRLVDSPVNADITLILTVKQQYTRKRDQDETNDLTEHVLAGKEEYTNSAGQVLSRDVYHRVSFKVKEVTRRNTLTLKSHLKVTGEVSSDNDYTIDVDSKSTSFTYSGDVPAMKKYKDRTEGELKSEQKLGQQAKDELEKRVKSDLVELLSKLKDL